MRVRYRNAIGGRGGIGGGGLDSRTWPLYHVYVAHLSIKDLKIRLTHVLEVCVSHSRYFQCTIAKHANVHCTCRLYILYTCRNTCYYSALNAARSPKHWSAHCFPVELESPVSTCLIILSLEKTSGHADASTVRFLSSTIVTLSAYASLSCFCGPSACQSFYLSVSQSVSLFICLSVCPS